MITSVQKLLLLGCIFILQVFTIAELVKHEGQNRTLMGINLSCTTMAIIALFCIEYIELAERFEEIEHERKGFKKPNI